MAHPAGYVHLNELHIPPFFRPDQPVRHPDAQGLEERGLAWLSKAGLCSDPQLRARLSDAGIGELVAWTVPHGRAEETQVVTDLNFWYHALDDTYGDGAREESPVRDSVFPALARCLTAPESTAAVAGRFGSALRGLRSRIGQLAHRVHLQEWKAAVCLYLLHEKWEADLRHRLELPDLDAYAVHCADGRASAASMAMLPIAGEYCPPDHEMERPIIRALTDMASVIACWDNDLYSFAKERHTGGFQISLLPVVAAELGSWPEGVILEAMALRDRVMVQFDTLRMTVKNRRGPGRVSDATRQYVDDLSLWISGQLQWGLHSPRFAAPQFAVRMPTAWADRPYSTGSPRIDLRRLPSITWWWDHTN